METEKRKERTQGKEEVCVREENERQKRKTGREMRKRNILITSRNEKKSNGN